MKLLHGITCANNWTLMWTNVTDGLRPLGQTPTAAADASYLAAAHMDEVGFTD